MCSTRGATPCPGQTPSPLLLVGSDYIINHIFFYKIEEEFLVTRHFGERISPTPIGIVVRHLRINYIVSSLVHFFILQAKRWQSDSLQSDDRQSEEISISVACNE